ncbi:MAG: C10 family peptidase [Muribaculaceae bacterium]|nr:C10 family peptidase [Muribaculaceae bacterium]
MKRLSLLIFSLISICSYAEGVAKMETLEIAKEFFKGIRPDYEKHNIVQFATTNHDSTIEAQPFYIYTDKSEGGFIIISEAKDGQYNIIGYSESGRLSSSSLPPQLSEFLKNCSTASVKTARRTSIKKIDGQGVLLNTSQWGQGYPYNLDCPQIDGTNTPTGCVATAIAIIMKYHGWPAEYSWDLMPAESITTENRYISSLMAEIGDRIGMNYSPLDSEAYSGLISQVMFADFGFSHQAQMVSVGDGNHINQDNWNDLVVEELNNGRPVIYLGSGTGSHAFIVDGYNVDGQFHINWGWDGSFNGYFDLNQLLPYDGAYFSNRQGMVMSLMPGDTSDDKYSNTAYLDYGYLVGLECMHGFGVNLDVSKIEKDVPFNVTFGTLNVRPLTWFGIALTDENDKIKEVLYSEYCSSEKSDEGSGFIHYAGNNLLTVTCEINEKDKLRLIAKDNENSPWLLVRGTIETPSYQNVNDITSRVTTINWFVPEGIEIKCRVGNDESYGTLDYLAKGSLLEVSAYSDKPGFVDISLGGNNKVSQDISLWEYGKTGATNSIFCMADILNVDVKFIPDTDFEDVNVNLAQPGTLEQALDNKNLEKVNSLTIKGQMDNRDFIFIRNNLSKISSLDISGVSIEQYGNYQKGHLPEEALSQLNRLKTLNLPNIEVIESKALYGLNSLFDITLPETVKEIGENAFYECNYLKRVVFENKSPFKGHSGVFPPNFLYYGFIVVPQGAKQAYENMEYSEEFGRIIEGDLVPAKSIKISYNEYDMNQPIEVLYRQAPMFNVVLEPENSTDYIISAVPEENRYLDVYYSSENIQLNVSHSIEEEKIEEFFVETSGGVRSNYTMKTIPPIKTFRLQKEIELNENDCVKLDYELYPSSYNIIFTSEAPDIAYVMTDEGYIYAEKEGETIITASVRDAVRDYSAQCKVRVVKSDSVNEIMMPDESNIKIYNIDGICLGSFSSIEDADIDPGFYIIRKGHDVKKVFIGLKR